MSDLNKLLPEVHQDLETRPSNFEKFAEVPRPSLEEIYRAFDEAGVEDFVLERDVSLPVDRDLF